LAAPLLVNSSPVNGATDVHIDAAITLTFDTNLQRTTVSVSTAGLFRYDDGERIPCRVSLSSNLRTITILPGKGLLEDVLYVAWAAGANDNMPGGNVKASDGSDLADSVQVQFRTRVEPWSTITEVTEPDQIERVGPIRYEEDIAQVTGYLDIEETTPAGFQSDVDLDLSQICVDFGEAVSQSGVADALELTMRNVLGLDTWYGVHDGTGRVLMDWMEPDDDRMALFVHPTGEVSFVGNKVCWTKSSGQPDFLYNTEVIVKVRSDSIVNATGEALQSDVYFSFTTDYFPLYQGVEYIRLQLGRVVQDLFDDTIRRHIHAASIDAVDQAAGQFNLEHPFPAVRRYVLAKAILGILDEIGLLAALKGGQRKTLGDFTVDYTAQDMAKVSAAYRRADEDLKKSLRELRYYRGQSKPLWVTKGSTNPYEREDFRMRTWQGLRKTGQYAANTMALRDLKSQLSYDHPSTTRVYWIGTADDDERLEGVSFPWWY
jgi:hypothetical protein